MCFVFVPRSTGFQVFKKQFSFIFFFLRKPSDHMLMLGVSTVVVVITTGENVLLIASTVCGNNIRNILDIVIYVYSIKANINGLED